MQKISYSQVDINNGFWKARQETNRKITINAVLQRFKETGRFDAFKCDWKEGAPNKPHFFWDSDVAKWIEGAAYILKKENRPDLEEVVEWVIDQIQQNQDENGYFNIYFTVCEPENRYRRRSDHELYCAGHLIEAAVAYYEATGKDRFLKLMCKYADHIERVFKIDQSAAFVTCGHEEIELALVRLYQCTKEERYLRLAEFFVNQRGNNSKDTPLYPFVTRGYDQSHLPVRKQITAQGHCVRACYLYSAMADLAKLTGDNELFAACESIFDDIITKKMYITGGIGQTHLGEAFTIDYDLPNQQAYAETCASIALAFFAQRMLHLNVNSKYADIVEKVLYNGIISGISLSGDSFFYENPLEIDPKLRCKDVSMNPEARTRYPLTQRVAIFDCSCCPPNLNRFLASVGDYIYTKDKDTYYIHQYISNTMKDGDTNINIATGYPNNGRVTICATGVNQLALRIPAWCDEFSINTPYTLNNGYAYIKDVPSQLELEFSIKPCLIQANPNVQENAGKVALQMGPFVYCLEGVDNGENLKSLWVDKNLSCTIEFDEFFNTNVIYAKGYRTLFSTGLYYPLADKAKPCVLKFIPYFGFANRGETEMLVWVKYR